MLSHHKISAIVYFVKNLQKTISFYHDVMGIKNMEVMDTHDGQLATVEVGDLSLVFIPSDEKPGQSPVIVFGLDGGIENAVEGLMKNGVEIVTPVSEAPDGGLTADFLDPDGHVLSFHQPAGLPRKNPE